MTSALLLLVLVVIFGIAFDVVNGFHDSANAIATVVTTGVLPLRTAVLMAATLNLLGALSGTAVATTIGEGLIARHAATQGVVLAALIGAIAWNLTTWYLGLPSSSSHALVGGMIGSATAKAGLGAIKVGGLLKIIMSLIVSPFVGLVAGFLVMVVILWICREGRPSRLTRIFRRLQIASAALMAVSHGSNDAQKTMGLLALSVAAYQGGPSAGYGGPLHVPTWVILVCAAAMACGTLIGGARIIKTLGTKIVALRPVHGFAAETSAAVTILAASHLGLPVSTTHVISGAIMGVGSSQRVSAVRWGVAGRIAWGWVLTIPTTALVAGGVHLLLSGVIGL